jgi:hypothetical protein
MKKEFRRVNLPPMKFVGPVLCNRCGKEYDSTELISGVRTTGHQDRQLYAKWYCPTEDCSGFLASGVYFKPFSS